jgi:hypothetical protein
MTSISGLFSVLLALHIGSSFEPFVERPQSSEASGKPIQKALDCTERTTPKHVKYRIATRTRTSDGGLFLHISLRKDDFNYEALLTLACRLTSDWSKEPKVFVSIFDNYDSARRYVYPWEQEKPAGWKRFEASLRAYYLNDPSKHEHWIAWYADPANKDNKEGKTVVDIRETPRGSQSSPPWLRARDDATSWPPLTPAEPLMTQLSAPLPVPLRGGRVLPGVQRAALAHRQFHAGIGADRPERAQAV